MYYLYTANTYASNIISICHRVYVLSLYRTYYTDNIISVSGICCCKDMISDSHDGSVVWIAYLADQF